MGFPREIKTKALIASARHCCVCHRYKGLKIEVHHIEPVAKGGPDTFDNAIPLCFDCHSDAGHYNLQHPKGLKLTKKELILARDKWYNIVNSNNLSSPNDFTDHLNIRHLVLQNYDIAFEIFNDDYSNLPFKPLVIKNDIFYFVKKILDLNKKNYKVKVASFKEFENEEDIISYYPQIIKHSNSDLDFAYYWGSRTPLQSELECIRDEFDSILEFMLNNNIKPEYYAKSVITKNENGCGSYDNSYQEDIIFKDIWFSFLSIENISNKKIVLDRIVGNHQSNQKSLKDFFDTTDLESIYYDCPKNALLPGEIVIIPTSLILCPFKYSSFDNVLISSTHSSSYSWIQEFHHISRTNIPDEEYYILGESFKSDQIDYYVEDKKHQSSIHPFDLTNMYTFSRYWQCGSCPHIFFIRDNNDMEYFRNIFNQKLAEFSTEFIIIPENINKLIISELEDEITYIKSITKNGNIVRHNLFLRKGESAELNVQPKDNIKIIGFYSPFSKVLDNSNEIIFRNAVITKYLRDKTMLNKRVSG